MSRYLTNTKINKICCSAYFTKIVKMYAKYFHDDSLHYFSEEHLVSKQPINLFKHWYDEACNQKDIILPGAFCLATSSKDGIPSARFVMLQNFDNNGFKFYSDYGSRKAKDIEANPYVAATFYWEKLNRSIRIERKIDKISREESEEYFKSKSVKGQVVMKASHQSTLIECREVILQRMCEIEEKYVDAEKEIPIPDHWGGYIIEPSSIEFWQGQRHTMADRIRFRKPKPDEDPDGKLLHKGEDGWVFERLSP